MLFGILILHTSECHQDAHFMNQAAPRRCIGTNANFAFVKVEFLPSSPSGPEQQPILDRHSQQHYKRSNSYLCSFSVLPKVAKACTAETHLMLARLALRISFNTGIAIIAIAILPSQSFIAFPTMPASCLNGHIPRHTNK